MNFETKKYDPSNSFEVDVWIKDPTETNGFDRTSMLIGNNKRIRIDWCNYSTNKNAAIETLFISESKLLFFGARFFWGIIDLKKSKVIRIEECEEFWSFSKYPESILVIKELEAESLNEDGVTIDKVPIDPPWESKEFDDYIEFVSPVYGKQKLIIK